MGSHRLLCGLVVLVGAAACGRTSHHNVEPSGGGDTTVATGAMSGSDSSVEGGGPQDPGGDGGAAPVGEAGAPPSGMAGEGTGGVPECDLVVPRDVPDIDEAMRSVTPPATVCLEAGTFASPSGSLIALRDGVSVRGLDDSSALCGTIDVSAGFVLGIALEHLVLAGPVHGQTPVKLTIRDVDANKALPGCPAQGAAIDLHFFDPSDELRLRVEDVRFSGPGVLIETFSTGGVTRLQVDMRRSSCFASQCWDLVRLTLGSLAPGSHLDLNVENNIVQNTVLQAIAVSASFQAESDAQTSYLRIVSNTIHSQGDLNYGIFISDDLDTPGVVANNAIEDIASPLAIAGYPATGNISSLGDADEWFVDAAAGSFAPAAGSLLRGRATAEELPIDDFTGQPRTANDVGALEFR